MQQITVSSTSSLSSPLSSMLTTFTPGTLSAISSFVLSPGRAALVASGGIANELDTPTSSAPLLTKILKTFSSALTITSDMANTTQGDLGTPVSLTEERDGERNLIDLDLDEFPDSGVTDNGEGKSVPTGWSKKRDSVLYEQWTEGCVNVVTNIGLVLPDMTCGILLKLMGVESDPKVCVSFTAFLFHYRGDAHINSMECCILVECLVITLLFVLELFELDREIELLFKHLFYTVILMQEPCMKACHLSFGKPQKLVISSVTFRVSQITSISA